MARLKTVIRKILFLVRREILQKPYLTIVNIDGGICSQMWQYVIGQTLVKLGRNVKYDILWYQTCGKDIEGIQDRCFDLLKLFPDLPINIASKYECMLYRKIANFRFIGEELTVKSDGIPGLAEEPVYVGGYYKADNRVFKTYNQYFIIERNKIVDWDEMNEEMACKIEGDVFSVGVHIRRGDMSKTQHYWKSLNPEYFKNAISAFDLNKYRFYFFSDDMLWVEREIIPLFDMLHYECISLNDSAHGYRDLVLLSLCKHQIASQGSLGKVANFFNLNPDKILVLPLGDEEAELWEERNNTIIKFADIK